MINPIGWNVSEGEVISDEGGNVCLTQEEKTVEGGQCVGYCGALSGFSTQGGNQGLLVTWKGKGCCIGEYRFKERSWQLGYIMTFDYLETSLQKIVNAFWGWIHSSKLKAGGGNSTLETLEKHEIEFKFHKITYETQELENFYPALLFWTQ